MFVEIKTTTSVFTLLQTVFVAKLISAMRYIFQILSSKLIINDVKGHQRNLVFKHMENCKHLRNQLNMYHLIG